MLSVNKHFNEKLYIAIMFEQRRPEMTIYPESIDTDLSRLLTDVQNGSMQLPEFQRDWVWDDGIRGIIASLSQGYPIGAILCV